MRWWWLSFFMVGCGHAELGCEPEGMCVSDVETLEGMGTETTAFEGPRSRWVNVDGYAVVEGDIIIGTVEEMAGADRGAPHSDVGMRWTHSVVPYEVGDDLHPSQQDNIEQAMDHWHANTDIVFVPRTDEAAFVRFVDGSGCSSWVGMQGGMQEITLNVWCSVGNAIHEMGHAVGLWHEHTRPDRDDYVLALPECVEAGYEHNFETHIDDALAWGEYDLDSIMHYGSDYFLDPSKTTTRFGGVQSCTSTLLAISNGGYEWIDAQRDALSSGDIAAVTDNYADLPAAEDLSFSQLPLMTPGGTATVRVQGADIGEKVYLIYAGAIGPGPCIGALGGNCLDLVPPIALVGADNANTHGEAVFTFAVPDVMGLDQLVFQAAVKRGPGGTGSIIGAPATVMLIDDLPECGVDEIPDCVGNCYPASWVGDSYCDDGTLYPWGSPDFMCDAYGDDDGDCD